MIRIQTPNEVIRRGIALTGIHPDAEDMPAVYLTDGLAILNDILDEWGGSGIYIPYQTEFNFTLAPGKSQYTVSETIPADMVASDIIQIITATLQEDEHHFVLQTLSESQYSYLGVRNQQQRPSALLLRCFPHYSQLIFDTVPDKAYSVQLICKQRLAEVDLFQQLSEVPPHYLRALTYQVAVDFAARNGASLSPTVESKAKQMITNLLAANTPDLTIQIERAF